MLPDRCVPMRAMFAEAGIILISSRSDMKQIPSIGNFGLIDNDTPKDAYTKVGIFVARNTLLSGFSKYGLSRFRSVGKTVLRWNWSSQTSSMLKAALSTLAMTHTGRQRI